MAALRAAGYGEPRPDIAAECICDSSADGDEEDDDGDDDDGADEEADPDGDPDDADERMAVACERWWRLSWLGDLPAPDIE